MTLSLAITYMRWNNTSIPGLRRTVLNVRATNTWSEPGCWSSRCDVRTTIHYLGKELWEPCYLWFPDDDDLCALHVFEPPRVWDPKLLRRPMGDHNNRWDSYYRWIDPPELWSDDGGLEQYLKTVPIDRITSAKQEDVRAKILSLP